MKAIIGMLIIMGISKLSTLEMYCSTNNSELPPQLIRGVMPRSRQLLRFLYLNSIDSSRVTTTPNYNRLYKRLDIILPIFESAYTTHQDVSVDEAIIPFRGRLGFKQYMKDKPTKWYKSFCPK